ncbi:MAG: sensor domain-containing diguanylate cyclase [Candidatus Omnitrophica bacterium]|nr:sensor domain-containing diguanylate cyclase [Candidatus Omnitrophota bacterium]
MRAGPHFTKGKQSDVGSILVRASRGMTQIEDPAAYLKLLARIIEGHMEVSHVGVLLYHKGHTAYVFHTTRGREKVPAGLVKLEATNPLVDWFRAQIRHDQVDARLEFLSLDYLEAKERSEQDDLVYEELKRLHATLCVPCFFRKDLVGLILLGSKVNGSPFSQGEIRLLLILSHHAAMGVRTAELQNTAMTDELTGTYNRRSFMRRLEEELERGRRYGHPASLVIVDIDQFKRFNDRFGHTSGDSILRQLAILLTRNVRRVDVVCRYGGEEFSIIMPETGTRDAELAAQRIQGHISAEIWVVDKVTVSMGIASDSGTDPGLTPTRLVEQADQALYQAKMSGRDKIGVWSDQGTRLL